MTPHEVRQFKVDILDDIHELATEPVADPAPIRDKIVSFLRRVESELNGEKATE
jgi:hypothetical protein